MQHIYIKALLTGLIGLFGAYAAHGQGFNQWQGSAANADWDNPYKWKLQHVPSGDEMVHFREDQSIITINSTIDLDNGMMLYGQDLILQGDGNINLLNPVPHRQTVNIPASATGCANLTLGDTLSLNGRIALAAKAFGTSSSEGSVTLKDQSTITGVVSIGNSGCGTGRVFITDQATLQVSGLELNTDANKGGMAEIHLLGGTANMEAGADLFETFMADSSRRIIIGGNGKLIIESDLPNGQKEAAIAEMIGRHRITAADDYRLTPPVIHDDKIILSAISADAPLASPEAAEHLSAATEGQALEASIDTGSSEDDPHAILARHDTSPEENPSKLKSLLQDMESNRQQELEAAPVPVKASVAEAEPAAQEKPTPLTGYIVFVSAVLFLIRPKKNE